MGVCVDYRVLERGFTGRQHIFRLQTFLFLNIIAKKAGQQLS